VAEAAEAVAILREVARWLVDTGRPLWPVDGFDLETFELAARAGELALGYEDALPVACMLLQARDDVQWPEDAPGEARYVHKLAVRRCAAGHGWPGRLIRWACARGRAEGVKYIRLDTARRRELISLYESFGFRLVDPEPRLFGDRILVRLEYSLKYAPP